MTLKVYDIIDN